MKKSTAVDLVVMGFPLIVIGLALTGCTLARYEDSERKLLVVDIHPTGNTVAIDGVLEGRGALTINRQQGGTEGLVSEIGDIASPSLLP